MTESNKCFADSNVWIYRFVETQDAEKSRIAIELLDDIKPRLYISTQVINEVCVILKKKAGFDETRIKQLVDRFYFDYKVFAIDQATLIKASEVREEYPISFWDGIIVASSMLAEASTLYSEDMQDGLVIDNRLTIQNPFIR